MTIPETYLRASKMSEYLNEYNTIFFILNYNPMECESETSKYVSTFQELN